MIKYNTDKLVLFAGICLPIVFIVLFPNSYHHYDVGTFISWNKYSDSFIKLYDTDCLCNYPGLGLLLSSGVLRFFQSNITYFRLFLSLFDIGSVLLIYFILKLLCVSRPGFWAGIIGILPSSWIGTSFWGQIDNISQFFLLALLGFILWAIQNKHVLNGNYTHLKLFIIGLLLSFIILTKQITYFSLFTAGLFLFYLLYQYRQDTKKIIISISVLTIAIIIPITIFDHTMALNSQYFSHLERVLLTGSDHMNELSGRGFNVWMLLNRDMGSSTDIPFWGHLTPKVASLLLFGCYFVFITYLLLKKGILNKSFNNSLFVTFIFHLLLTNIGFNMFLTGTHERYLIHFYPFVFIALLYYGNQYLNLLNVAIYGSLMYGLFVLQIILKHQYMGGYLIVGLFHLVLLIQLTYTFYTLKIED